MTFYDPVDELNALEAAFDSTGHAFHVVYSSRQQLDWREIL
jgi:hypothetical protein